MHEQLAGRPSSHGLYDLTPGYLRVETSGGAADDPREDGEVPIPLVAARLSPPIRRVAAQSPARRRRRRAAATRQLTAWRLTARAGGDDAHGDGGAAS